MGTHDETAQSWGSQLNLCSSDRRSLYKTFMTKSTTDCTNKITLPCLRLAAGSHQQQKNSRHEKKKVFYLP